MDELNPAPVRASLAGLQGSIVGVDDSRLHWEVEIPAEDLGGLIARLTKGDTLAVTTNHGLFNVKTRDWIVWPLGTRVKLRLALEDATAW